MRKRLFVLFTAALSLLWALQVSSASAADATFKIQLVNQNSPTVSDSDVWVIVTGGKVVTPADESGSCAYSGVRDMSLPVGHVTKVAGQTLTINGFSGQVLPKAPFPIQFFSGKLSTKTVKVTSVSDNTFTIKGDISEVAINDSFYTGAYSQKLSTFPTNGTVTSPLTGQTYPVYEITLSWISSGVIYVSTGSGSQLTYVNSAPAFTGDQKTIPFQTIEVSSGAGIGSTGSANLTVIDYFSIPMQLESVYLADGKSSSVTAVKGATVPGSLRTFFMSKPTIEKMLTALGAQKIETAEGGLARYLGPGHVPVKTDGSFPASFTPYVKSLVGKTFTVTNTFKTALDGWLDDSVVYGISKSPYYASYDYTATVQTASGFSGYQIVMTGTTDFYGNSAGTIPPTEKITTISTDVKSVTINLPTDTKKDSGFANDLDEVIYGAVLTVGANGAFSVKKEDGTAPSLKDYHQISTKAMVIGNPSKTTFQVAVAPSTTGKKLFGTFVPPFWIKFADDTLNTNIPKGDKGYHVATVAKDATWTVSQALPKAPPAKSEFDIILDEQSVLTAFYTNSAYANVASDALCAFHFGFLDSEPSGKSTKDWYGGFPPEYPFEAARIWEGHPNDKMYNEYAELVYSVSGAYSFAFSDRIDPSPLITIFNAPNPANPAPEHPVAEAMRISILPETQLDAPVAWVASNTTDSSSKTSTVKIEWNPIAPPKTNLKPVYNVSVFPPATVTVDSKTTPLSATIADLTTGMPYRITVSANTGEASSLALPFIVTAAGDVQPTVVIGAKTAHPTPETFKYQASFNWDFTKSKIDVSKYQVFINGSFSAIELNPEGASTENTTINATLSTADASTINSTSVRITDKKGVKTLYNMGYTFDCTADGTVNWKNTRWLNSEPTGGMNASFFHNPGQTGMVFNIHFVPLQDKSLDNLLPAAGKGKQQYTDTTPHVQELDIDTQDSPELDEASL